MSNRVVVENNALSVPGNKSRAQEMAQCQGGAACEKDVIDKYKKINAEQHESVVGCKGAQDCVNKANEVSQLQADYASRTNELLEKVRTNGGLSPAEQDQLAVLQVTTIQLEADRVYGLRRHGVNQGMSAAARAWEKHAGRPGGTFEPLKGNQAQKNAAAENFIRDLLNDTSTVRNELSRGGVEYRASNGQGVRFNPDGSFNTLLDPPVKK